MEADWRDVLKPDDTFHGYVVRRRLGKGGNGSVYLVRHAVLDTPYALKLLDVQLATNDETSVKRFLREARLATRIRHPNLVVVHDCGYDEERRVHYLVMDYVEGVSLRDTIGFEGPLELSRAVRIVSQVVSALQAAQAFHVVHRDIKPENIIIQPNGLVKLLDLGIAKADNIDDSFKTDTDSTFGTPAYISPEQAQCSADVDSRADIYSLGVVFYEMLAGKCPYAGANAAEILRQIFSDNPPPDIREAVPGMRADVAILLHRMMEKNRDCRLATFDVVLQAIADLNLEGCVSESPRQGEVITPPAPGMETLLAGLNKTSPQVDGEKKGRVSGFWKNLFGRLR